MARPTGEHPGLRRPWSRSERPVPRRVFQPLQSFLAEEAAGGVFLLAATVVALAWANSPWRDSYQQLWGTSLTIGVGRWAISEDLAHWVNDGLLSLFFLVVGLEIKRELVTGELREAKAAALPVVAALGGMVVPALLYLAVNAGREGARGWGIPMATDTAFALGVLTLAARRAPANLKPFLLTLAIVDDIGAILILALFYSGGITWGALAVAVALCAGIFGLERIGVRATAVYVVLGIAVWVATFESGIHPSIAGVALGLLTPAVPFQRPRAVSDEAHRVADETVDDPVPPDADAHHWLRLAWLSREAVSPLARLESTLHPWTSFVVVPLFALANAGVHLTGAGLRDAATSRIAVGIVLGLVVGKPLGISLGSFVAVRTGIARLPAGVAWRDLVGAAAVAGIGFTVSLFVAELAFANLALVTTAKIGILSASIVAGAVGYGLLRLAAGRSGRAARVR
ncbi:MAG: Na+/H+ antiporter NhaA [Actinobacteria bacterium]|nr:MAG: Na+/H+ antiporter NhaA [Actinomycetota bacterium]